MFPTIVLLTWPLVSVLLFAKLGGRRGLVLSVVIGLLFLPGEFKLDLPGIPTYDKATAISAGLVLSFLLFRKRWPSEDEQKANRLRMVLLALFALYLLNPALTVLTNREPVFWGPTTLPALQVKDIVSLTWSSAVSITPFLFGWRLLSQEDDHRLLLRILVIGMLGYSLLAVFEMRMSPQLNNWIYGYFPHSWLQHIRGSGFRPIVFLSHGLVLAFLLFCAVIGSAALSRSPDGKKRLGFVVGAIFMLLVLLATRNLGSTLLALLFLPIVLFLGMWPQIRIAAIVAIMFLAYPALRQSNIVPIENFSAFFQIISKERAGSFDVRMRNEEKLLERATQKPLFGWGSHSRNRIFNEFGRDISLVDGAWIGVIGARGWLGFVTLFGLMSLPVIWLGRTSRRKPVLPVTAALAVIMAANLIELVPNSTLTPITFLMAGALAGFVIKDPISREVEKDGMKDVPVRQFKYSRFDVAARHP